MFDEETEEKLSDANAVVRRLSKRAKKYGEKYSKEEIQQKMKERKKRRGRKEIKHQSELLENLFDFKNTCTGGCIGFFTKEKMKKHEK